jgi:integrase/recombinase XerC
MTAFALPASVLDAIFRSDAAPVVEATVELDDDAILEFYAHQQRARGLCAKTLDCYHVTYRAFVRDLATSRLSLLTVDRAWIGDWIAVHGTLNRTRNHYTTRLVLLFRWMQDEGWRPDLPTKGLPKAKVPRSVPRPVPNEGLRRALALADSRVGLMLVLGAYGGLRCSEIAGIDRSDILDDRTPPLLLVHGKGSKERLVPIGPVVAAAFERYGLPATGPLFVSRKGGGALTPHTVGQVISEYLRASGVNATAHQLRHRFATALYEASGGDLLVTQQMLGHASPSTTAIYAAWSPDRAASAIAKL